VLNIQGIRFRLIDTAGIREARDQIEAIGVQRTLAKISEAALLVYVFDILDMRPEEVAADLAQLRHEGLQVLLVANKMDLNPYAEPAEWVPADIPDERLVPLSAREQMNIALLREKLYTLALANARPEEDTLVSNVRHAEALHGAATALEQALQGLAQRLPGDLLAQDIRQALFHLGEITGEVTTEDLLENIFRKFCIGK
jgi:tRNA modification GTPase